MLNAEEVMLPESRIRLGELATMERSVQASKTTSAWQLKQKTNPVRLQVLQLKYNSRLALQLKYKKQALLRLHFKSEALVSVASPRRDGATAAAFEKLHQLWRRRRPGRPQCHRCLAGAPMLDRIALRFATNDLVAESAAEAR